MLITLVASTILALGPRPAAPPGQSAGAFSLQQRLVRATTISCRFSQIVTGAWSEGVANAVVAPAELTLTFTNINVDDGSADADRTLGGSPILVRAAGGYVHLMQMDSSGPLYTTTVIAKETHDGRLMAVHTRHQSTDPNQPGVAARPQMYIGDCALTP